MELLERFARGEMDAFETLFRQFQADGVLQRLLLDRQRGGEINVIDEGQAWHLCVCPGAGRALRLVPDHQPTG